MKYYSVIKKNKILSFEQHGQNWKSFIMLSKISQTQKEMPHVLTQLEKLRNGSNRGVE